MSLTLVLVVIAVALVFEFINGFHDTANAIATVIGTKVLTPRQAIILATFTNLIGALVGGAVAQTVAGGLIDSRLAPAASSSQMLICALLGAILWNLLTWYLGLPSSSSHALVGGLCGAAVAAASGNWQAVIWAKAPAAGRHWWDGGGVLYKVVLPMITSPICGLIFAFVCMAALYFILHNWRPATVNRLFGKLQLFSAAYMGFGHGTNDAQKTMGIIALALVAATKTGAFAHLPAWLQFLDTPEAANPKDQTIASWIKVLCALTMAAGTAAGGWRIIKTLGHKMVKLQPVNGFAAETVAATVLLATAELGMPVSTTHVITSAIMGVGAARRLNAIKWSLVERIVWAWILTLPATAAVGYVLMRAVQWLGWAN
ncbi:MAG: inorganic phosphate transporter family protein [Verrucomicrobia bacterium]|nr:inorganic phosphate transporter family protein [Verrucomicrobiota bacterium]